MQIKKAVRHAVSQIISIAGVSGSGKTYSALLLAAGMAGPSGKIGFIDTENGRGCMYADSPGIMAALPQGYDVIELAAPFHPARYIEAIDAFERDNYNVVVIDSGSHAWEGEGGCTDIAERDKGRWNNAKRENKRLVMRLLYANMHIIVCLRAREKSKIIPKDQSASRKEEVISLGIQPICEKNFPYEMLLSFMVEEKSHLASVLKCPEGLIGLFQQPKMLTRTDGEKIIEWNNKAPEADPSDRLKKRARVAAEDGKDAYASFYKALPNAEKKILFDSTHEENKYIAEQADVAREAERKEETNGNAN